MEGKIAGGYLNDARERREEWEEGDETRPGISSGVS